MIGMREGAVDNDNCILIIVCVVCCAAFSCIIALTDSR